MESHLGGRPIEQGLLWQTMMELDHVRGEGEHLQFRDVQDICVCWVERVVPVVALTEATQARSVVLGELWRVSECVPVHMYSGN